MYYNIPIYILNWQLRYRSSEDEYWVLKISPIFTTAHKSRKIKKNWNLFFKHMRAAQQEDRHFRCFIFERRGSYPWHLEAACARVDLSTGIRFSRISHLTHVHLCARLTTRSSSSLSLPTVAFSSRVEWTASNETSEADVFAIRLAGSLRRRISRREGRY